ncbi:MAG: hypothetical protein FWD14_06780 [Treponema sp.]|nr:hypothetical protein [Treponema sp.]
MHKQISFITLFVFLTMSVFCDNANQLSDNLHDQNNRNSGTSGSQDIDALWRQFLSSSNADTMAEILITLGTLGKGNKQVIDNLNNHLMGMNLLFRSGSAVNYTVVSACISAIMELGDSSSYPALFSVLYAGYPEVIASEAQGALEIIPGNFYQFLLNVIQNNPPDEKFAAFRAGMNSERLSLSERGQLAERALEQSLNDTGNNIDLTAMRYSAVLYLNHFRWTRANALVIRHYYRVQSDFLQDNASKERFIEAIACLGAVGDSDAALVLGLQLGLINARTESTGAFDPDITMAIVRALGNIGFHAAFDHLLSVSNLSYPEDIQIAAREAVDRLKW